MTPIINPIWFYLAGLVGKLDNVLWWTAIFVILSIFLHIFVVWDACEDVTEVLKKTRPMRRFIVALALLFITIFIPSETTIYRMMVATWATGDNITEVTEAIKNGVDYIVEKVKPTTEAK
jgi:hypothetical protein